MYAGVISSLAWSTDSERLAVVLSPASPPAHCPEGPPEHIPATIASRRQQGVPVAEQSCGSPPQPAAEQSQPQAPGQAAPATQPQRPAAQAAEHGHDSMSQPAAEQSQPQGGGRAAQTAQPPEHHRVQVWQRGNWNWYCKAEHWYSGSAAVVTQWDSAHPMRLAVTTAEGMHRQVRRASVILVPWAGGGLLPQADASWEGGLDSLLTAQLSFCVQHSLYLFSPCPKTDTTLLRCLCRGEEGLVHMLPNKRKVV